MKVFIKKHLLLKSVQAIEKNIGRNLTLPVLNNVLIKTQKDSLNLISTDLELAVSVSVPAKIETEGSIVVPPRVISGFLSNIPEGNISIYTKESDLFLEQASNKIKIKGASDKEFPIIPKVNREKSLRVQSSELIKGLQQIISSVAVSDFKPELTGVLFSFTNGELKLASTDSFRLSEKTITEKTARADTKDAIIPAKTIQEIIRNYQEFGDILYFYLDKNQVATENTDNKNFSVLIVSKIIEGDYPEYTRIIPTKYQTKTIVSKEGFIKQIKSASLFSSKINDVKINIKAKNIEIRAENNDVGTFESSVDASTEGENKEIVFNCRYVLDGLNSLEGDEVVIKLNDSSSPAVMESTKHKNYFYILMPIKGN